MKSQFWLPLGDSRGKCSFVKQVWECYLNKANKCPSSQGPSHSVGYGSPRTQKGLRQTQDFLELNFFPLWNALYDSEVAFYLVGGTFGPTWLLLFKIS